MKKLQIGQSGWQLINRIFYLINGEKDIFLKIVNN